MSEEFDAICDLYRASLRGPRAGRAREGQQHSASSEPNPTPDRRTSEPEAGAPHPASGANSPDPQDSRTDGGQSESSNDGGAKSDGRHSIVGQGGAAPIPYDAEFEQQDASASQGRNEPASDSGATATTNSAMQARTTPEVIRLLRPHCLHVDDLAKCGGQGTKHCQACLKAAEQAGAVA